jgi:hypothetical protein
MEKEYKKRNPVAKALATPLYKKRVINSKKKYNRKKVKEGRRLISDPYCF